MSDITEKQSRSAYLKTLQLRADGMEPIGQIFVDPDTGKRATLDDFGRVQWWDVDGSGYMLPMVWK